MTLAAAAVHQNGGNLHLRLQLPEAQHYRRRTAPHAADIDHQQHRAGGQDGDLRRGSGQCCVFLAVIQPHHALNDGQVSIRRSLQEILLQIVA